MRRKIIAIILLSTVFILKGFTQDDFEKGLINDIKQKYQKIDKGEEYSTAFPHLQEDDDCVPTVKVKKKDGELRLIDLSFRIGDRTYEYLYYYWKGDLIFVFTTNCVNMGEDDNGIITIRCYEYRHYYVNENCIKSTYTGYEYGLDEEPIKNDIIFYDYDKAYDERENAHKYLIWSKTDSWSKYCK